MARPAVVGWRRFFLVAGLFNILGGAVGLLDVSKPFVDQGLAAPNYPFAFQLLFLAVIIFGIGLLMAWRDPHRHRGVLWLVLLAKIAGLVISALALASGQLPSANWWQPLVADLPWAVGIAIYLWRVK